MPVNLQATNPQNLGETEVGKLLEDLSSAAEEYARSGEVSVFNLVDRCQEWLREAKLVDAQVRALPAVARPAAEPAVT